MTGRLEPAPLRNKLIDALQAALNNEASVETMLDRELSMSLNQIIQHASTIESTILAVVAESESRSFLLELIAGASSFNPTNDDLRRLIEENLQEFLNFELDPRTDSNIISSLPSLTKIVNSIKDVQVIWSALSEILPDVSTDHPNIEKYLFHDKLSNSVKCLVFLQPFYRYFYGKRGSSNQFYIVEFVQSIVRQIKQESVQKELLNWLDSLSKKNQIKVPSDKSISGALESSPIIDILKQNRPSDEQLQRLDASFLIFVKPSNITDDDYQGFQVSSYLVTRLGEKRVHQHFEPIPKNGNVDAYLENSEEAVKDFLQKLEASLPVWIKQVETCVGEYCEQIQEHCDFELPPNYDLIVEFWLPVELLDTPVEIWEVYRKGRSHRKQDLRLKHDVVIRSYNRFSDAEARNELFQGWRDLLEIKQNLSNSDATDTVIEFIENWARLDPLEDDLYEDGRYLGLALCGQLCLSKDVQERERLIDLILDYGIPMMIWSRDSDIIGLKEKFAVFFECGNLFSTKQILSCIKKERKDKESALGKKMSLWYDDPKQFSDIRRFLKEGGLSA